MRHFGRSAEKALAMTLKNANRTGIRPQDVFLGLSEGPSKARFHCGLSFSRPRKIRQAVVVSRPMARCFAAQRALRGQISVLFVVFVAT